MEAYKEYGKINTISKIQDGAGRRKAKQFLDDLFKGIIEQSVKYMDIISTEAPYTFKERQFHSLLAPSLAKITDTFLMEQPIDRQWSKNKKLDLSDSHGWLDYWCRHGKYDYFIELKHNYDVFSRDTLRKRTVDNWIAMNKQLDVAKKEAKSFAAYCDGVFLISLHAIVVYETVKLDSRAKSIENEERLLEIQNNYFKPNELNPNPNWSGMWIVPEKYVNNTRKTINNKSQEFYPSLILVAKVSEAIVKK